MYVLAESSVDRFQEWLEYLAKDGVYNSGWQVCSSVVVMAVCMYVVVWLVTAGTTNSWGGSDDQMCG